MLNLHLLADLWKEVKLVIARLKKQNKPPRQTAETVEVVKSGGWWRPRVPDLDWTLDSCVSLSHYMYIMCKMLNPLNESCRSTLKLHAV